jgi:shikimate dehydrogenase
VVTGSTNLVGIIGNPVSHSLSPAMHNAAFQALKMDWLYVPLPVLPHSVGEALRGLLSLGFRGANVTVPHKERVVPFLDEISVHASRIGAVNTITVHDGRLLGDNTDWSGILEDLKQNGFSPSGRTVMILGSGGSARAVAYAVASAGADTIIGSRNSETAGDLCKNLREHFPGRSIEFVALEEVADMESSVDLLVNTTPLGMTPQPDLTPWPAGTPFPQCQLVYDLVYNPRQTRLMKQAREMGLTALNGLGMLVHQAAAAFSIWTGVAPSIEVMRDAAEGSYK